LFKAWIQQLFFVVHQGFLIKLMFKQILLSFQSFVCLLQDSVFLSLINAQHGKTNFHPGQFMDNAPNW